MPPISSNSLVLILQMSLGSRETGTGPVSSFLLAEQGLGAKVRIIPLLECAGSRVPAPSGPTPQASSLESRSTHSLDLLFLFINGRHGDRAELAHVFRPFGHHHLGPQEKSVSCTARGSVSRTRVSTCVRACVCARAPMPDCSGRRLRGRGGHTSLGRTGLSESASGFFFYLESIFLTFAIQAFKSIFKTEPASFRLNCPH